MNNLAQQQGIVSRNVGADIIRCLAFLCVVSVHFLLRNGFYQNVVQGEKMLIMVLMRSFFIICVPLYMMLSGYLMHNKQPTIKYYSKLGKTYLTYVLACVCCLIYSSLYLNNDWHFKKSVFAILDFSAAPYSWYVEMYLGLFLIIPFINFAYNNISTQNLKKVFILVLVIITALPSVINVYNFEIDGWWMQPNISKEYSTLIPQWWTVLYPVTYYVIGCYLAEYGLKIKKTLNILLIFGVWLISGLYNYWRQAGGKYIWGDWCDYESLFNVVLTTLVFTFFINRKYQRMPNFIAKSFKTISGLCFASYLVSWIFDNYCYTILLEKVPKMTDRLPYYFVIVPVVFICSLLLSYIISKVQFLIEILFDFIKKVFVKSN